MADDPLLTAGIDDFLLAIARGLRDAQSELHRLDVETGGATVSYHLPKVEFELKMTVQLTQPKKTTLGTTKKLLSGILIRPIAPGASTVGESVSTIRGSFIAVPANNGVPATLVRTTIRAQSRGEAVVAIESVSALGERVPDVRVELNVDRDASRRPDGSRIAATTDVRSAVLTTDATGAAQTSLIVDSSEPTGTRIQLTVDGPRRTETFIHVVGT